MSSIIINVRNLKFLLKHASIKLINWSHPRDPCPRRYGSSRPMKELKGSKACCLFLKRTRAFREKPTIISRNDWIHLLLLVKLSLNSQKRFHFPQPTNEYDDHDWHNDRQLLGCKPHMGQFHDPISLGTPDQASDKAIIENGDTHRGKRFSTNNYRHDPPDEHEQVQRQFCPLGIFRVENDT